MPVAMAGDRVGHEFGPSRPMLQARYRIGHFVTDSNYYMYSTDTDTSLISWLRVGMRNDTLVGTVPPGSGAA